MKKYILLLLTSLSGSLSAFSIYDYVTFKDGSELCVSSLPITADCGGDRQVLEQPSILIPIGLSLLTIVLVFFLFRSWDNKAQGS